SRRVSWTRRLAGALDWTDVLHEPPSQALVPTYSVDVDGVGLCRVHAHVEGDVLALVDTGGGGVPLDLAHRVRTHATDLPRAGPRLLILDHDRVVSRRRRSRSTAPQRTQTEPTDEQQGNQTKLLELPHNFLLYSPYD